MKNKRARRFNDEFTFEVKMRTLPSHMKQGLLTSFRQWPTETAPPSAGGGSPEEGDRVFWVITPTGERYRL